MLLLGYLFKMGNSLYLGAVSTQLPTTKKTIFIAYYLCAYENAMDLRRVHDIMSMVYDLSESIFIFASIWVKYAENTVKRCFKECVENINVLLAKNQVS